MNKEDTTALEAEKTTEANTAADTHTAEAVATADEVVTQAEQLKTELEKVKQQNLTLADEVLRAKAEVQNVRRRSEEEILKAKKFGIENFAESLLPVVDSLEAALKNQTGTAEQYRQGTELTLSQLLQVFERNKIVCIDPQIGELFDPNIHQAISTVASEQTPNTVVTILQKGYLIAERVIRPALVVVAAEKKD